MTIEQKPASEISPQLPALSINIKVKAISIGGRTARIRGDIAWQIFLFLALNPNRDFPESDIKKSIKKLVLQ